MPGEPGAWGSCSLQTRTLRGLVEDLLEISRLDAGSDAGNPAEFDATPLPPR